MAWQIRVAKLDDAAACAAIYRPAVEHTAISFETEPPGETEMRRRIGGVLEYAPWLVYEADGHVAGFAYGGRLKDRAAYRWCVEGSAYLDPGVRGKGVGTKLLGVLIACLRAQGFTAIYGAIALPNEPSVKVSERLGLRHIGTFPRAGYKQGRWHDVGWWHMELNPPSELPPELLTPAQCISNGSWGRILETVNKGAST